MNDVELLCRLRDALALLDVALKTLQDGNVERGLELNMRTATLVFGLVRRLEQREADRETVPTVGFEFPLEGRARIAISGDFGVGDANRLREWVAGDEELFDLFERAAELARRKP